MEDRHILRQSRCLVCRSHALTPAVATSLARSIITPADGQQFLLNPDQPSSLQRLALKASSGSASSVLASDRIATMAAWLITLSQLIGGSIEVFSVKNYSYLALLFSILPLLALRAIRRRSRVARVGLCRKCSYDLRAHARGTSVPNAARLRRGGNERPRTH